MNYTDRRAQTPTLCTFYNSDFLIYSSRIRPRIADWPAAKPPACRTRLVNTLTSRSRPICWPRLQSGARVSRPTFPSRFRYRCQLTAPCVPHLSSRTPGHRRLDATKPTAWRTSIVAVLLVFGLESRRDQFWSVWVVAWLTPVRAYLIYSSMGSFYIPCIVMTLLYWRIFHAIRQRARKSAAASALSHRPRPQQQRSAKTSPSSAGVSGAPGSPLPVARTAERGPLLPPPPPPPAVSSNCARLAAHELSSTEDSAIRQNLLPVVKETALNRQEMCDGDIYCGTVSK